MSDQDSLGDLPNDIGTDHNQLLDVPGAMPAGTTPAPGQARQKQVAAVPGAIRWAVNAIIPFLLPSLRFTGRPFNVGTESIELSGQKTVRRYLFIQNSSAGIMYINFDNEAGVNTGIKLTAGASYEPFRVPKNSINVIGDAAGLVGFLVEG